MVLITLIGQEQAHVSNRFYYMGPQTECKECKLKTVCFNLEQGRQYEITGLRDTMHECEMHEEGVRVVEVEKIPTIACIPKKSAIEGGMITYDECVCSRLGCENWNRCHPIGLKAGDKLKVDTVIENTDCPLGYDLKVAKLA